MMAVVDAHYNFLFVAVGAQGSANDAAVFNASSFAKSLEHVNNPLAIPPWRELPGTDVAIPMVFVADDGYPLRQYLMKPFSCRGVTPSERIYNYRLSRARRVVENAFGILVNRFRILRGNMQLQPEQVSHVVLACCALHNFLRKKDSPAAKTVRNNQPQETNLVHIVEHTPRLTGANYNASAKEIRDKLAAYFVGEGQVNWQWKHANVIFPSSDV